MRDLVQRRLLLVILACLGWNCLQAQQPEPAHSASRPAVLIHSPSGTYDGQVDLDYLADLHRAGLEVDYTDHHQEFTWDRLRQFNAVVIYGAPDEDGTKDTHIFPRTPPYQKEYGGLLERYLKAGGGVFIMAATFKQPGARYLAEVIEPWGARLPVEWIKESGPTVPMSRMPSVPLVYTEHIEPSPVSESIGGIWYPCDEDGGMTDPIWVSEDWMVVVRSTRTSHTVPVTGHPEGRLPKKLFVRPDGVKQPPLFAIREYQQGRIAFMAQWPQFSFAQGTKWLYNREVLSEGVDGRKSDFGRLQENTLRWLSEPSLRSGTLGGHRTNLARFKPPNYRTEIRKDYEEVPWPKNEADIYRVVPQGIIYRGLIGARTSLSSGQETVKDYARVAKEVDLDFVVFLEDFATLTPDKWERLKEECKTNSDSEVKLFPGYAIDNNTGNHMFLHGFGIEWPPDSLLVGPEKTLLNQQYQNEEGEYEVKTPLLGWLLRYQQEKQYQTNIGYYNFAGSRNGMQMPNLRMYSQAAVRFYEDGKLVEDVADDYLTTAQGTIPPGPVSVNLVRSTDALKAEVAAGHALTFGPSRSLEHIYQDVLRYTVHEGVVFCSDGPIIETWPAGHRVTTYGAEDFVTGLSWMRSPLSVSSRVGLKEVRIHDGMRLFRRFLPGGVKQFQVVLQLEGTLQRNLVLIAEDREGKRAVSFVRKSWKQGSGGTAVAFCGDHVNDCWGQGALGKGPLYFQATRVPILWGGVTWDGGPQGANPLIQMEYPATLQPLLVAEEGSEGSRPFDNIPLLESSDERSLKVRSVLKKVFSKPVPVHNAWHTHGPVEPSRLFDFILKFTSFQRPSVSVVPAGWAGQAIRKSAAVSTIEGTITFKRDLRSKSLRLLYWPRPPRGNPVVKMVTASDNETKVIEVSSLQEDLSVTVDRDQWIGFFSPSVANNILFINRGSPLEFRCGKPGSNNRLSIWPQGYEGRSIEAGDSHHYELMTVHDPLDVDHLSGQRFQKVVRYLENPDGLEMLQGRRLKSSGLLELHADGQVVELRIVRPVNKVHLSLPLQVRGLNPRWTAGFFQIKGANTTGYYGTGENRYTALGFDMQGMVRCSLYPDDAETTHAVIGHPVVADEAGKDLFIQVTHLSENPQRWHVSVNNPTDKDIRTTLRQAIDLPGFSFPTATVSIPAGGYEVLKSQ